MKKEEVKEESTSESILEPVSPGTSSHDEEADEEESTQVTEELIVMAAYTLGQCRQSSDKESLTPDQKAISKRFKFEEPFSALQEVPGEFIYWFQPSRIAATLPTNAALQTRILLFVFCFHSPYDLNLYAKRFFVLSCWLLLFLFCNLCAALYLHV